MPHRTALAKRMVELEFYATKTSKEIFPGNYRSTFKGRGMSFDKVREYLAGDDVRSIDWNVTARLHSTHVKVYEEERDLNFMIIMDYSKSMNYGGQQSKKNVMIELASIFIFTAIRNKDKIGAIIYTDQVEKIIPPAKGRKNGLRLLSELLKFEPKHRTNNLSTALKSLDAYLKKTSYLFIMSDFLDDQINERDLKRIRNKHDITAFVLQDKVELELPRFGFIHLYHAETANKYWFNTMSVRHQKLFKRDYYASQNNTLQVIERSGIDLIKLHIDQDYTSLLKKHFARRK